MGFFRIVPDRLVPFRNRRPWTLRLRRNIRVMRQCGPSGCGYQRMYRQEEVETSDGYRGRA
jgi:hypothetical protein